MRKKLRGKLTTTRGLVVIVGLVFALTWAMPAVGASPLKLAKKALTKAKTALDTANKANDTANQALAKANGIQVGARAYARMDNPCATSTVCTIDHAKGISQIRHTSTGGLYCVTAPGLSPTTDSWFVSADAGDSGAPTDTVYATPNSNGAACNSGEFEVQTLRIGTGNATNVAFFVTIP